MITMGRLCAAAGALLLALVSSIGAVQGGSFPAPVISATIPDDAEEPAAFLGADQRLPYLDDYSWQAFVAVNWPAGNTRGDADLAASLLGNGPRVWESWKAMYEVFPDAVGETPDTSWTAVAPLDTFCATGGRRIAMSRHPSDLNQAGASTSAVAMGPLVDRDGRYVQYEIRVNRRLFDSLMAGELFRRDKLDTLAADPKKGMVFHPGAIAVKAAWKEVVPSSEVFGATAAARYYQTVAQVLDPETNTCVTRTMALVALHIAQKTPRRPQWIWSTFEHVDLLGSDGPLVVRADHPVPSVPAVAPATPCELPDLGSGAAESTSPAPVTTKAPWPATPVALARLIGVPDCTSWTNTLYRRAITNLASTAGLTNPVWANYALVATQWPNDAINPVTHLGRLVHLSEPQPHHIVPETSVANVAIESYRQTDTSCLQCHSRAKGTDFVLFPDLRAFPLTSASLEHTSKLIAIR